MDKITYAQVLLLIAVIVFGIILVVIRAQGIHDFCCTQKFHPQVYFGSAHLRPSFLKQVSHLITFKLELCMRNSSFSVFCFT